MQLTRVAHQCCLGAMFPQTLVGCSLCSSQTRVFSRPHFFGVQCLPRHFQACREHWAGRELAQATTGMQPANAAIALCPHICPACTIHSRLGPKFWIGNPAASMQHDDDNNDDDEDAHKHGSTPTSCHNASSIVCLPQIVILGQQRKPSRAAIVDLIACRNGRFNMLVQR